MFALFLAVLGLAGGCVGTYFVMEAPRRRSAELLQRLGRERDDLRDDREQLTADARDLSARTKRFEAGVEDHRRRVSEWDRKVDAFEKRVISYSELEGENRLLKTDLKNLAVQLAYFAHAQEMSKAAITAVEGQRDQLGRSYLDEAFAVARKGLTPNNYTAAKQRFRTAVERTRANGFAFPPGEEKQAIQELHTQYEKAVRVAVEREEQTRIREKIREEQVRERQAKEEIEKAERERRVIEAALNRALADATGRHDAEVEQLRRQLAEAEAKSRRTISLAEITRSGYVYVISNHGSFGNEVFKIGMTRRLDPMDRVYELGDASVPFPFDVHMMITSDDAPGLEKALHHTFRNRRVNRVNLRKEFFRVTIDEIATAVRQHHGEVEYTADAEALEYLQSQTVTDEDLAEAEEVYEEAEEDLAAAGTPGDE